MGLRKKTHHSLYVAYAGATRPKRPSSGDASSRLSNIDATAMRGDRKGWVEDNMERRAAVGAGQQHRPVHVEHVRRECRI